MPVVTAGPIATLAVYVAILLVLLAAAIVLLVKWRGDSAQTVLPANTLLTKFKEIYGGGGLSEEEYRTIRTKLKAQLHRELKDNEETG